MPERMTPDEARALLDGTTPGPWIPSRSGYIGSAAGVMIHDGHVLGDTDADTCLIAAAPTLAAMIAGMREEWGVKWEEVAGPTTFTYGEWADSVGKRLTHHTARLLAWEKVRAGYPNVRIVRRYVTTEEEA